MPKTDPDALLSSGMGEPTGSGLRTPFTIQGPNVQSSNNEGDYTSRWKNEFANRLYPTKQDFNMWEEGRKVLCVWVNHLLQKLELKLKARGLSVLLFTAECKKLERKEKEFFFLMILLR